MKGGSEMGGAIDFTDSAGVTGRDLTLAAGDAPSSLGGILFFGGGFDGGGGRVSFSGAVDGGCGCPWGMPAERLVGGGGLITRAKEGIKGSIEGLVTLALGGGGPRGKGIDLKSISFELPAVVFDFFSAGSIGLSDFSSISSNMVIPPAFMGATGKFVTGLDGAILPVPGVSVVERSATGGRC
jgi:hypothetical protein